MEHLKMLISEFKALLDSKPRVITKDDHVPFNKIGLKIENCCAALEKKHKGNPIIVNALDYILMEGRKLQLMTPRWFSLPLFNDWVKEPLTPETGMKIYNDMIEHWAILDKTLKEELQEVES